MPKWTAPILGVLVCAFATTSTGLIVYVFTRLEGKVDKMSEEFASMQQKVTVMDAKIDTIQQLSRKK